MNRVSLLFIPVCAAALLAGSGCATTAMKGTPFFTGEYAKRLGPVEDRVNLWPVAYHRDPALSVLWPVFEHVEQEHFAVRPIFSAYNLASTNGREWNVLWPLFQQDNRTRDGWLFPFFWGDDHFDVFPLYWHDTSSSHRRDALLPLWWYYRNTNDVYFSSLLGFVGAEKDRAGLSWWAFPLAGDLREENGDRRQYALWPLAQRSERHNGEQSAMVLPIYYEKEWPDGSAFHTLLAGSWSNAHSRGWSAPALLSWYSEKPGVSDLWLAGELAHLSSGTNAGTSHVFPLYYRDAREGDFLSLPYAQWRDGADTTYCLPWLGTSYTPGSDGYETRLLLLFSRDVNRSNNWTSTSLFPVFSRDDYGPLDRELDTSRHDKAGSEFWCLPWCWRDNVRGVQMEWSGTNRTGHVGREYSTGVFPLWSLTEKSDDRGRVRDDFSFLLWLYDSNREITPLPGGPAGTNDYVRRRVLWHVWHYEKLNGDVSVDMIPGITWDKRADGHKKFSLLWRLFRWERSPEGARKLDLLFLPLIRDP